MNPPPAPRRIDFTRRAARAALVASIVAIAIAYGAAFTPGGAPLWAPWLLAVGVPAALVTVMILGAARGHSGIGQLKGPFAFVFLALASGFCLALGLPATEGPSTELWLGLPARAAIVLYGIGLLPTIVLPVAYALTFESQTLDAADIEKVREVATNNAQRVASGDST